MTMRSALLLVAKSRMTTAGEPVSEKASRADVVIDTDRPMLDTEAAVRALYAGELLREEGERHAG